jgi:flagellar biosynthesis/type III secretory pathway protein FliH
MANPEHLNHSGERGPEHPRDLERAPEVLNKKAEIAPESKVENEQKVESAREEANKEALSGRETSQGEHKPRGENTAQPLPPPSRKQSFTHTMKSVRAELSAPERTFSKVIHNPIVERTSEVIGSTVARPDAILSGSVFACVLVLTVYLLGRYYGFELRGSETIITFGIGWLLGVVFDFLRAMITGKRS